MREQNETILPPVTRPIDCQQAQQQHIADRYVLGQLSPEEIDIFEDHYLACKTCSREVERAELLVTGLNRMAAKGLTDMEPNAETPEIAGTRSAEVLRPRFRPELSPRRISSLLAAALAGAVLTLALWIDRQNPADLNPAAVSVFHLQPERSSPSEPTHRIPSSTAPILALELTPPYYSSYRARLQLEGRQVWQADHLKLGERQSIHVRLPDELSSAVNYVLAVEGSHGDDVWFDVGLFAFLIEDGPKS